MTESILAAFLVATTIWFVGAYYLRGADLRVFDCPRSSGSGRLWQSFSSADGMNDEHQAVIETLSRLAATLQATPRTQQLAMLRSYMESMFADCQLDAEFIPVHAGGVPAEWVLAPGADPDRRALYIHGGAYTMGSPLSHRVITSKFSEISGGAVLAIDYRLMPENRRIAGIEDCRTAYRWILENGPDGPSPPKCLFVAGDSAGGNLTLSLIAWVRDQHLRAPDAAVALAPQTDATFGSPSLKVNLATDAMLGPMFAPLTKVPRSVLVWAGLFQNRMRPCNPTISPVFGDLSNLPPLLIHASESEMLLDDSIRYFNKATSAGSPVTLQTWGHAVHVWHIFHPNLTEAREAFEEIRMFLALNYKHVSSSPGDNREIVLR